MKTMYRIWMLLLISLVGFSCTEELDLNLPVGSTKVSTAGTAMRVDGYCGSQTYTLYAGQTMDFGTLTVSNDETNLYVTYNATVGTFGTLHLFVGSDFSLLPMNKQGTPIPGQFPYVFDATGLTNYTFTIPLNQIPFFTTCGNVGFYVVAHAEMGSETAFGGNITGTNTNRWYYYAIYPVVCCENPPVVIYEKLGTAFAKGNYVFTTDKKSNPEKLPSLGLTKNRWGWAINLYTIGSYTYNLYVGAGLNDISKGIHVGTATIEYNGTEASVNVNLFDGYNLEELHIYADDLRPSTLTPGQYGNTFYFNPMVSSYSFTATSNLIDSNNDGIWLIIHGVVYGARVKNVN